MCVFVCVAHTWAEHGWWIYRFMRLMAFASVELDSRSHLQTQAQNEQHQMDENK